MPTTVPGKRGVGIPENRKEEGNSNILYIKFAKIFGWPWDYAWSKIKIKIKIKCIQFRVKDLNFDMSCLPKGNVCGLNPTTLIAQ